MMSRNSETIFTNLPSINIQRSIMDINSDHKTTFDTGELIPFYWSECLPSDSVKIRTNKVIRLQTLLTPLMDSLYLDTFYFFIPARLTWNHWKEFMGENTGSAYLPQISYRPPVIKCGASHGAVATGDLLDYFGCPLAVGTDTVYYSTIALPYRAYLLCWNEFFRDQNLQDPINVPLSDSDISWKDAPVKTPLPVNRLHDYFSSALKAPAKNADGFVTAMTSRMKGGIDPTDPTKTGTAIPVMTGSAVLRTEEGTKYGMHFISNGEISGAGYLSADNAFVNVNKSNAAPQSTTNAAVPDNLYSSFSGVSFGITIPDLRQAFQMQKFLEREASHGSRYQETLLSHFTVRAMDARLQRPEYLGGNRVPLNISQIVNQAQSDGEFLGDLGGMSLTCDSHFDVEYSCQEHGYILGLACVRYKSSYNQGYNRMLSRNTRYDYAWPEFAHLTDQEIRNYEIYYDGTDNDYDQGIFGYAERYAEYKYRPDYCSGEMRPGISNSLASWHLGDYYTGQVFLSDEWLRMSKNPVDRALAVTSNVSNQIFGDFYTECRWTRPLPVHSNPGFADHF